MIFPFHKSSVAATVTYIGTVVGVGIFGLPFVFSRAGYLVGLAELIFLAFVVGTLTVMYAELTITTSGQHRFITYIEHFLGSTARRISLLVYMTTALGSLLAFTILGGTFLHNGFPLIPTSFGSCLLLGAVACTVWGGFRAVSRLETAVVLLMFMLYGAIILLALPAIHLDNVMHMPVGKEEMLRPFGILLFSLAGFNAVPEMHDLLGRRTKMLPRILLVAGTLIVLLYALFTFAVIGVTGEATTTDAIGGLSLHLSPVVGLIGIMLGIVAVFSIFTEVSTAFIETLRIDLRLSHRVSWFVTFAIPLSIFLMGVRTFVDVVGFIGSICTGTIGILIVLAYEKMKKKHNGRIPSVVSYGILAVFLFGIFVELMYTFT